MREPRLWRYVLMTDKNFAPHIDNKICSLVCCKPKIRKYAIRGDWIIGFAPSRYGKALVRYAMEVTEEPLPFKDYWKIFKGRRDAIYKPDGDRLAWHKNDHNDHPGKEYFRKDTGGVNALVSKRYWYFNEAIDLYSELRPYYSSDRECREAVEQIYFGQQGQKYSGITESDFEKVRKWLKNKKTGHLVKHPQTTNDNGNGCIPIDCIPSKKKRSQKPTGC